MVAKDVEESENNKSSMIYEHLFTKTTIIGQLPYVKVKKKIRDISRSTEVCNEDTDMGMVAKDVQESKDNKACIICDNMFTKTTIIGQIPFVNMKKLHVPIHFPLYKSLQLRYRHGSGCERCKRV